MDIIISAVSAEVVEAVYRTSSLLSGRTILGVSLNQADFDGGYINNWNTREFIKFTRKLELQYPSNRVVIARMGLGPGLKFCGTEDLNRTVEEDTKYNIRLFGIDVSKSLNKAKDLVSINTSIERSAGAHEIYVTLDAPGTAPQYGKYTHILNPLMSSVKPVGIFVPNGGLVRDNQNVGERKEDNIIRARLTLNELGTLKMGEEQVDYLRPAGVDILMYGPELAHFQTQLFLSACIENEVLYGQFKKACLIGQRWEKWVDKITKQDHDGIMIASGHYHYRTGGAQRAVKELNSIFPYTQLCIDRLAERIFNIVSDTRQDHI